MNPLKSSARLVAKVAQVEQQRRHREDAELARMNDQQRRHDDDDQRQRERQNDASADLGFRLTLIQFGLDSLRRPLRPSAAPSKKGHRER